MRTVQVPGYGPVKFPSNMSDAEIALAIERDILPTIKPPAEGLGAALVGGAKRFGSTIQTALESILSPEEAAKRGLARQEEISRAYAPGADLEAVKRAYAERGLLSAAGEAVSQIPGALAEQAPNIAATLAGARAGARFGLPGAIAGATLPAATQLFGSALERQAEAGAPEISRAKAAAAAVPGAVLEVAATFIPLGRGVVGKLLGPEVEKALARGTNESIERLAQESLGKVLTKGVGVGVLAEVPTEVTQQILERAQAGLPLTTPDALAEYGEAAYGAGLVGGPFGAVGRVAQRGVARGRVEERQAEERRLQEELATAEREQAAAAEEARKQTPEYRQELNSKIVDLKDELAQVEPIAKDKSVDEEVRNEAVARANEIKQQLKELNAEMKASMKEAGAAPTLASELAKRKAAPTEKPIVDEFGNIIKPKKAAMTEEEYAEGYDREAERMRERNEAIRRLREKEEAELAAKREKTYEETQRGVQTYLAQLQELEQADIQETAKRVAAEQQRREEDVAQEMTLERIQRVLDNFGLRAAGVTPEVRALVESKIDEGVIDRTVTKELGIQGLEGRTYRGEQAVEVLPNIKAAIDKLEEQRQKALVSKKELMDNKGQLTPAGYKLVANEAKLNELKRLQGVIEGQVTPETGAEAAVEGRLEAESREAAAPLAVDIEPGKPSGVYRQQAEEANKEAGGRFTDLTALMDDYRKGRFFGEKGAKRDVELASSMRAGLLRDTEEARSEITDSLIKEIAYRRVEQGMRPFTKQEAQEFGLNVDNILAEIIRRSTALPSGYSTKTEIIEPAQMRGSEIVKSALTVTRDTRDLSNRQFGAPQRAIEVLAEAIRQAKETAIAEGKRPVRAGEKPLLRKQYAAAPTDLIKDLDRVLRMENLQPEVRDTLEAAQRRMEEGGASEGLEDLVEEQVGRILRGTDRPFVLERDVTKPGGRRAMGAAGTAELIDEIKTQMRFDAEQAQFTGEQMTTVPKGREFREERVQPDLFPETVATERATPGMFQRLQKSAPVRKEKARIAEAKKKAEQVRIETQQAAREVAKEFSPQSIQAKQRDLLGKINALVKQTKQDIQTASFQKADKLLEKVKEPRHQLLLSRLEQAAKDLKAEDAEFEISTEGFRLTWVPDTTVQKWIRLDESIAQEIKDVKNLEDQASKFAKGSLEQRKAKALATQQRVALQKVALARRNAAEQLAKRETELNQKIASGLGLPGTRLIAKTREEFINDLMKARKEAAVEFKKAKAAYAKLTPKEKEAQEKPVKKVKLPSKFHVVPIKSKAELDAEIDERQRESLDDLRRRSKVSSPEAMYDKLKAEEKEANIKFKNAKDSLAFFVKQVNAGEKVKNFPKYKQLSAEIDKAKAQLNSIRENIRLLEATQYEPEKVKRQAARGPVGGAVPFYDKKFTPDQLRNMSGLGLSAFSPRSYSVDDSIDFAISDKEGGGIDLEQANKRMAEVEKRAKAAGIPYAYFPTMKDVTVDILKSMARQGVDIYETRIRGGVKPDGTVFVIGENHTDMTDLEKTIAHEFVGHYSFEGLLGEGGMKKLLGRVDKAFGSVFKLADTLGVRADADAAYVQGLEYGLKPKEAEVKALREVVAYTMEKRVDQSFLAKAKRWLQELIGAMRNFFKGLGMDMDLSTSDLFYMLKQANQAFEEGKPIAYKKADGTIDFREATTKYAPGLEDLGAITDKIVGRQRGMWDSIKANAAGLTARVQFVDRFAALEALANRGVAKGIIDSLKAQDMMYFARMSDQRHSFVAEIANNGTLKLKDTKRPDGRTEKIIESERGASLKDISQALLGAGVGNAEATGRLFTLYLAAERAQRVGIEKLNFSGRITKAELDKALQFGRSNAAFQKARELYNDYNRGLIEFAVETGALGKEEGARLAKTNDYVPFYRMRGGNVELIIGSENPIRIGDIKSQPYLQELVGGDEAIMDFFTSSLQNTTLLTDMALRNLATRNVAFTLVDLGIAEVRSGEGPPSSDVIRFKMEIFDKKKNKVVHTPMFARINVEAKKEIFGDIPSDLVVKGMEGIQIVVPGAVRILAAPANWLRKFVTRDPRYAVRQIFRDSMAAALTTGANIKPVVDTMGEIAKMYGKGSEAFQKLQRRGVLGGQVITGAPEDMAKIMQQIAAGKPGWDLAMAKLDQIAMAGDAGTRIAMYNSFLKQGLSEREATLAALESMNFGRRGVSPSIYFLNATIPFFNAGIQGIDVLYRAFTGQMPYEQKLNVQKKLLMRGGMMALFTMAYAAMMEDDEAYKNAPPEQRYGNWFVRIPGFEEPFRVPIPFEVGLLFKAVPEGVYNAAFGSEEGKKVAKDLTMQLLRSLPGNPAEAGVPVPTAIKPFIETALNKSFFTGREIVDGRLEGLEKQYQYRDKTPELLKALGPVFSLIGLSPVQVENIIRGYTGSLGIGVASIANPILKSGAEAGEVAGRVSELPIIGGMFQPNDAGRVIDEAYDSVKQVQQKQGTYRRLIEEGKLQEAQEYVKDNISDIGLASYAGAFRQRMGEISKAERAIKAAPAAQMSPEKKREELDRLREIKIQMAQQFKTTREQIARQAAR